MGQALEPTETWPFAIARSRPLRTLPRWSGAPTFRRRPLRWQVKRERDCCANCRAATHKVARRERGARRANPATRRRVLPRHHTGALSRLRRRRSRSWTDPKNTMNSAPPIIASSWRTSLAECRRSGSRSARRHAFERDRDQTRHESPRAPPRVIPVATDRGPHDGQHAREATRATRANAEFGRGIDALLAKWRGAAMKKMNAKRNTAP